MRNLLAYLRNLWGATLFRKTVINFAVFFAAVGIFSFLTSNHFITHSPQRVVPADYAFLARQYKTMSAVELEQSLRSGGKGIEGLVFFDDIKSIVVLGDGFEKDKIVLHADTDEMRKLAKTGNIPLVERPSALEDGVLVPGWYPFAVLGFIVWFGWLMFSRREGKTEPSRIRVIVEATPRVMDHIIAWTKMKKSKFYLLLFLGLMTVNTVAFLTRLYHNNNLHVLPPEISSVQRMPSWQAVRHLEKRPGEYLRVTVVEELNSVYIVFNTATPPPSNSTATKTEPADASTAGKLYPVERTVVFPLTAQGKAEFDAFLAQLKARNIQTKTMQPILETSYIESMTGTGKTIMITLLLISVVVGCVTLHNWQEWKMSENPQANQDTRLASAGGNAQYAAPDVEVRVEDRKTFADVAGCQEAIDELRVVEKKIRRPKLYKVFGAPVPNGVMLYGPPGTGKTLLARALSGEIGGYFEALSGSQFVEMYVGVGAKRVREAYTRARTAARRTGRISIVFIDEIDAIAKKRGSGDSSGGDKEYEQTLNELLVQMNGFGNHGLVLTMAATNRLDILDEAILRPGRFDIKVQVPKPDKKGRAQIYNIYLKKLKLVLGASTPEEHQAAYAKLLENLARRSHDFTGAEIEGAIKNGATIAVERQFGNVTEDLTDEQVEIYKSTAIITVADLNEGVDKMAYGTQIKSRIRTDKERWATAVHEVGHASIPTVLGGDPVNRITIVMTDKTLGLMDSSPEEGERYDWTDQQFNVRLQTMLAGRAAEKILLSKISTGASNDFERASGLARQMVGVYGMSRAFGVKSLPMDQHGFPIAKVGEILLDKFNQEWGRIVDEAEAATDVIITKHRVQIEACARVLFEEETLTGDEFRKIWQESVAKQLMSGSDVEATKDGIVEPPTRRQGDR